jgi:hypothetical protein
MRIIKPFKHLVYSTRSIEDDYHASQEALTGMKQERDRVVANLAQVTKERN